MMFLDAALREAAPPAPTGQSTENQRRYMRAPLVLFGSCSLSDATRFPCHTRDLSAGGIAVYAPVHAQMGACGRIELERLGAFSGEVVRSFAGGFAIELEISQTARDRLGEQITWISMRSKLGLIEDLRCAPDGPRRAVDLRFADEERVVEILDVSSNGVTIRTFEDFPPGLRVSVGKTRGRVMHRFDGGAAIEFVASVKRLPCGALDL